MFWSVGEALAGLMATKGTELLADAPPPSPHARAVELQISTSTTRAVRRINYLSCRWLGVAGDRGGLVREHRQQRRIGLVYPVGHGIVLRLVECRRKRRSAR